MIQRKYNSGDLVKITVDPGSFPRKSSKIGEIGVFLYYMEDHYPAVKEMRNVLNITTPSPPQEFMGWCFILIDGEIHLTGDDWLEKVK